ncbi:MAG: ABC transporter permease, partial [Pseudomonadota bacterium]
MFQAERRTTLLDSAFTFFTLTFHNAVRSIRSTHRDALMAILNNIVQTLIMVGGFYLLFIVMGMQAMAVRGDFLLFVMSGIFVFMTHVKSAAGVMGADGPTSPMMKHLPMNQGIAV